MPFSCAIPMDGHGSHFHGSTGPGWSLRALEWQQEGGYPHISGWANIQLHSTEVGLRYFFFLFHFHRPSFYFTIELISIFIWRFVIQDSDRSRILIDYSCEECRFPVSASCVRFSSSALLSCSATGVIPGRKSWKKKSHLCLWGLCQKAIGDMCLSKKWRGATLQPGLEFDNSKPWYRSGIFKGISWLTGLVFWGRWSGFSERGSQGLSNVTNVAS